MAENPSSSPRLYSVDAYRGFAVLVMAIGNYIAGLGLTPAWLKHAPDIGYTVADAVAPMFIVAIGLTMGLSARRRRERSGTASAMGGMAARYLAIIGIGAIISAGQGLLLPDGKAGWGVLQAIGMAGLLTLAVIYAPAWARALVGLVLLCGYQLLLDPFFLNTVLASTHNGLIGSASWGGLMMLSTAAADAFFEAKTPARRSVTLLAGASAALAAGLLLSLLFPVSKNRASAPYMLVSLGLSLLAFLLAHILMDNRPPRLRWLLAVGKNPLAMYMAHLILLSIVTLPGAAWWYAEAPWWLAVIQGAALLAGLILLAKRMEEKGIILKL